MSFFLNHNFSLINIDDQKKIRDFTQKFDPFSDFNFTSLISWDTNDTVEFALYNSCLIIKLPDYVTQITSYSVLGHPQESAELIEELFRLLNNEKTQFEFAFVPSVSTAQLDSRFDVLEDIDQHDYIYNLSKQTNLDGHHYAWQRRRLSQFHRSTADGTTRLEIINPEDLHKTFLSAWPSWVKASENIPNSRYKYEKIAINRYVQLAPKLDEQIILGLFINDRLQGITMAEPTGKNSEYVTCHFMKVNYDYPGIFNKMFYELCKLSYERGYAYLNFEQDLGLTGLRTFKNFLKPDFLLKKYRLSLKA